jgi:hypothetical protein
MAKIASGDGPSSADVVKEVTLLIQQGKVKPGTNKLHEWTVWKVS